MLNSIDVWRFVKVACCSTFLLAPSTVSLPVSLSHMPPLSRTFSLFIHLAATLTFSLPPRLSVVSFLRCSPLYYVHPSRPTHIHARTLRSFNDRYALKLSRLIAFREVPRIFHEVAASMPAARAFRVPTRIFTLSTRTWHWRSSVGIAGRAQSSIQSKAKENIVFPDWKSKRLDSLRNDINFIASLGNFT